MFALPEKLENCHSLVLRVIGLGGLCVFHLRKARISKTTGVLGIVSHHGIRERHIDTLLPVR